MKKHNEGYVLPFVLVVLVVVCLVAVSLLTASLDNLKRQQASIDRMEAKYAAQGEIEKLVAGLEKGIESINLTVTISKPNSEGEPDDEAYDAAVEADAIACAEDNTGALVEEWIRSCGNVIDIQEETDGYVIRAEADGVEATLKITISTTVKFIESKVNTIDASKIDCSVIIGITTTSPVTYVSYTISATGGETE